MKVSTIEIRLKGVSDKQVNGLDDELITLLDSLGIDRYIVEINHEYKDGTLSLTTIPKVK